MVTAYSGTAHPSQTDRVCTDVVLNLTLRCPLRCSHCCYRSQPNLSGVMSQSDMERAIRAAADLRTVRTIHFSGGEPFLLPDLMLFGIRLASELGLRTAAMTSAFFGKTLQRSMATLEPMAAAGLSELCVSYDDMHAAYLPAEHFVNVMESARLLDLEALVSVTVEPGAKIDAAHVRRLLGLGPDESRIRINEVGINTTGRGADLIDAAGRVARAAADAVYRGPCRTVLHTIQVVPDGRVLPCCGVLPHAESMVIGRANQPPGLLRALRDAAKDPLWQLIASKGPVEILTKATANTARPVSPSEFDGICSACDRIFNDPHLLDLVRRCAITSP